MSHPYANLPPRQFWRTGVASANPLEWRDLYRKRFDIAPSARVASAGSCFAQHVGRQLAKRGFRYLDLEPPPPGLPDADATRFGYKLFSARYGNIYTPRQLLQLLQEALGERSPGEPVWETGGRFYDPLRPTIEPDGFSCAEEALALRRGTHLLAVRRLFERADLFVFTLGLTEAWRARADGTVYPLCPGVSGGRFDPAAHEFVNFTVADVVGDLRAVIERARAINGRIKFLLTVSPVPLTATATDAHVLAAATYSKSVLRAAAGEIYAAFDFVDYFPSYELVAAPAMRGMFFEPNLREVSAAGVEIVMRHFFSEHDAPGGGEAEPSAAKEDDDFAVVCDEERIDPVAA